MVEVRVFTDGSGRARARAVKGSMYGPWYALHVDGKAVRCDCRDYKLHGSCQHSTEGARHLVPHLGTATADDESLLYKQAASGDSRSG